MHFEAVFLFNIVEILSLKTTSTYIKSVDAKLKFYLFF